MKYIILFLLLLPTVIAVCEPEVFYDEWVSTGSKVDIQNIEHTFQISEEAAVIRRADDQKTILRVGQCRDIGKLKYCYNEVNVISETSVEGKIEVSGFTGTATAERNIADRTLRPGQTTDVDLTITVSDCADVTDVYWRDPMDGFDISNVGSPCLLRNGAVVYEADQLIKGKQIKCSYEITPLSNGSLRPEAEFTYTMDGKTISEDIKNKIYVNEHPLKLTFIPSKEKLVKGDEFDMVILVNNTDDDYRASLITIELEFPEFEVINDGVLTKSDDKYKMTGSIDPGNYDQVSMKLKLLDDPTIVYSVEYTMEEIQSSYEKTYSLGTLFGDKEEPVEETETVEPEEIEEPETVEGDEEPVEDTEETSDETAEEPEEPAVDEPEEADDTPQEMIIKEKPVEENSSNFGLYATIVILLGIIGAVFYFLKK